MADATPDDSADAVRMAIFRALIEAQDAGASVADSRAAIAKKFDVTEWDVREIERAGIEAQWPPL